MLGLSSSIWFSYFRNKTFFGPELGNVMLALSERVEKYLYTEHGYVNHRGKLSMRVLALRLRLRELVSRLCSVF